MLTAENEPSRKSTTSGVQSRTPTDHQSRKTFPGDGSTAWIDGASS